VNILVGIAGIAVSEYGYMLTLSNSVNTPYYTVLIFGIFTGATGYIALVPVSCNAYLADITPDKSQLTIRSGIFSVAQGLSSVLGGLLAGVFSDLSIPIGMDIELFMYLLAFLYVLWRIPQRPGIEEVKRRARGLSDATPNLRGFFAEIWVLLKQGFWTYTKPRLGHRRTFMFMAVFVLMLTYTTSVETRINRFSAHFLSMLMSFAPIVLGGVMNSYTFRCTGRAPFCWGSQELGYWNGTGYLICKALTA
jgi:MFS family permease